MTDWLHVIWINGSIVVAAIGGFFAGIGYERSSKKVGRNND